MKSKIFFLILLMIPLIIALPNQADNRIDFTYPDAPTNFSIQTVNSSDFWDNLDTPADITYDEISAGDVNALGYTGTFSYIAGVLGLLDLRRDPWYLGGTALQLGDDLTVDGDTF